MAYVMTYTTLIADLQAYIARGYPTDPTVYAQLPHLIAMAEKGINRTIKPQGFEVYVTSAFIASASGAVIQKPDRWRETFFWSMGTGTGYATRKTIFPRPLPFLRDYWPDSTQLGEPKYYSDYGFQNFIVAPSPALAYPFELGYYELLQPLDDNNMTNWLTKYAPDLLLFGTLLQAVPFLKNDERIPTWQQMYGQAVSTLMTEDARKLMDKSQSNRE